MISDTLYALASAPGRAGVAVIRVSGPRARAALEQLCGQLPPPRMACLRNIARPDRKVIDRGLVLWFPSPASYTGEDLAEFQVHGGRAVIAALTQALGDLGICLAEPGEFTRRAVVNGKLDLTEAEGVADLVEAQTEAQRRQALRQLGGSLHHLYASWRHELTRLQAHLEAGIDFADDDLPENLHQQVRAGLMALAQQLQQHLTDAHRGERLREGLFAAILGAPNAGKSSLLNLLARRDVAIVTPLAGTTRDVLEVQLDLNGYPLTLADTAGLREAADLVEQEGIRRALERARMADFRLLVFDGQSSVPDPATLEQYRTGDLLVINKIDLADPATLQHQLPVAALPVSVSTGKGVDDLQEELIRRAEELAGAGEAPVLTRARHREAVVQAAECLARALEADRIDQMAEDVRMASRALGRITGQVGTEELLDVIFRDFCLGK